MSKRALGSIAITLMILIAVVLFAGLDGLPRSLRGQIDNERQVLAKAESQFEAAKAEVSRDARADPVLSQILPDKISRAAADFASAGKNMAELQRLRKENRSKTRQQAERLLREVKNSRGAAMAEASAAQNEAREWTAVKPALASLDLAPIVATVQKAESDWPEKQADLERRLDNVKAGGEQARNLANGGAPLSGGDPVRQAIELPSQIDQLKNLTGQLYDSWDKVLVDLEVRRGGESRDYNEKVKTIRTHLTDVAAKKAETTSDEKWVRVTQSTYAAVEDKLGMTLEHKDAGKYDSEATRTPQPPGFAYVAPPSQVSNQYGYWEHRDGGTFWTFLPQYLIMRELLWAHQYRPPTAVEYGGYQTAQRTGQTYFGHDTAGGTATSVPKYGTHGTFTQSRYAGSQYVRNSGTYNASKYSTQSGTYRGSQYESHGSTYRPNASPSRSGGSTFGSSRSMPRSFPSSGGRRFGGGRRR
ncbi:MAG: hypothetical protein M3Z23_17690 [Acidobacteriota bacterium]|nr:hypothetical protein [Acidobacteriota bacterium]